MKAGRLRILRCFPPDYQIRRLQMLHSRLTQQQHQMLEDGLIAVVRLIPDHWTLMEKATVLYRAVTEYLRYDHLAFQRISLNEEQSYCYLGALFNGTAVCSGIAQLYAILCMACGIPCKVVEGYAGIEDQDELHAWVQIRLPDVHGNWVSYHCDPTWDLLEGKPFQGFRFFLKSDDYFETHQHQWYYAIGADLGWHKFDRCPADAQIPAVSQADVRQVVEQLKRIRLDQPYILKKE